MMDRPGVSGMPTILPDTAPALFGHDGLSGLRQQDPAKALGEAVGTAHVHVAPKHTPLDRLLARAEQRSKRPPLCDLVNTLRTTGPAGAIAALLEPNASHAMKRHNDRTGTALDDQLRTSPHHRKIP